MTYRPTSKVSAALWAMLRKGLDRIRPLRVRGDRRKRREPGPIFDDPLEALHFSVGGKVSAAFHLPMDRVVFANAFKQGVNQWNANAAALCQYRRGVCGEYEGSVLQQFYEFWQPQSAREAIAGFDDAPTILGRYPSYCWCLFPWTSLTPDELCVAVRNAYRRDAAEHGVPGLDIQEDGFTKHGPVSTVLGNFEYRRLIGSYVSIAKHGFDRRYGDLKVLGLRRGSEHIFLLRGGFHRAAALQVLGYRTAPAVFQQPHVFDVDDAAYWPQVRRGVWSRNQAKRFVDHLFEFDSLQWAVEMGLEPRVAAPGYS